MTDYNDLSEGSLNGENFINNLFGNENYDIDGGSYASEETIGEDTFINNLFNDENYDMLGGYDSEETIGEDTFINNLFNNENYDMVGGYGSEETIGEDTFINNLFETENHDIVGGYDSEGTIGEDTFINNLLETENYEGDMNELDGGFLSSLFNLFSDELSDSEGGGSKFSLPILKKKDSNKKQQTESVFFIDSKKLTNQHILKMMDKIYTIQGLIETTNKKAIKLNKSYYDILKLIGAFERVNNDQAQPLIVGPTINEKISGHVTNIRDTTGKHVTNIRDTTGKHVTNIRDATGKHVTNIRDATGKHATAAKTGTLKHVGKALVGVSHVPSAVGTFGSSIKSYGKELKANNLKGGKPNPHQSLFDRLLSTDIQFTINEHGGDAWLMHVYLKNIATQHHNVNHIQPKTITVSNISPSKPRPTPPSKPHNSITPSHNQHQEHHHADPHHLPPSDLPAHPPQ